MSPMPHDAVIRGQVASDGRLIAADPLLLAMQEEAGGILGGPLVVPALTQLVRLAGRLNMPIARPVTVAGQNSDTALWVQLKPNVDGVAMTIIEHEEITRSDDSADLAVLTAQAAMMGEGWDWHADRQLQFLAFYPGDAAPDHALPRVGETVSAYFRLIENDLANDHPTANPLPLLAAVAGRRPFSGQQAVLRADERYVYILTGLPVFDGRGAMIGYRGRASLVAGETSAELPAADAPAPYSAIFSRRLDHALRQPLGRIIANANTISGQLDGPLRSDYVSYASDIAVAGRHLLELVDDLADLQAIERPDFNVAQEAVDLADLARRSAGLLRMRAAERHMSITPPGGEAHAVAIAEYRRVLQILVNLIGNAVRYSPDGSAIWVGVGEDHEAGTSFVLVEDQGTGIDPADHERIFARFERLDAEDGTGSGLGLYISRRLARAMGGDIAVDSKKGQGARFALTLPLWKSET